MTTNTQPKGSSQVGEFLTRTNGKNGPDLTDILTYVYLIVGTVVMFVPVLWLVLSSFKTEAALSQFPPTLLPYSQETIVVEGYDDPLPLYNVTLEDGTQQQLAQVRRIGLQAQMIDPANPEGDTIPVAIDNRQPVQKIQFALEKLQRTTAAF